MSSIWHSLAWKEWHEHKWKLISITAILCGIAVVILSSVERLDAIALAAGFVTVCVIPLAVFVGLGVAAGERSRQTLPFLQALPVPMRGVAVTKLIFGLTTLGISVGLTTAFVYICTLLFRSAGVNFAPAIQMFEKDSLTGHWYLDFLLLGFSIAASLFIWSAAAGVNRKDEISAGAVALAVIIGWMAVPYAVFSVLSLFYRSINDYESLFATAMATVPGGFVPAIIFARQSHIIGLPIVLAIALLTHLAMAIFFVLRFGRLSNFQVRSPQPTAGRISQTMWLGAPRSSAFASIAWKQIRESGPIGLVGLVATCGITAVAILGSLNSRSTTPLETLGEAFPNISVFMGLFVALVAGIGVCLNDVSPSVNTFWRSRPIQPDSWYWMKYATGLLVVLTSIYLPIGVLIALHVTVLESWTAPNVCLAAATQLAVFAAAIAMTCLVRQAVYAAILSIAVVYIGTLAGIGLTLLAALLHLISLDLEHWYQPNTSQVIFGLFLSFITSTVIAWLATRYDWGRKSRY